MLIRSRRTGSAAVDEHVQVGLGGRPGLLWRGLEAGRDRALQRIVGAGQGIVGGPAGVAAAPPGADAPPATDGAFDPTVAPHDAATSTVHARAIARDRASGIRMTVPLRFACVPHHPNAVWQVRKIFFFFFFFF